VADSRVWAGCNEGTDRWRRSEAMCTHCGMGSAVVLPRGANRWDKRVVAWARCLALTCASKGSTPKPPSIGPPQRSRWSTGPMSRPRTVLAMAVHTSPSVAGGSWNSKWYRNVLRAYEVAARPRPMGDRCRPEMTLRWRRTLARRLLHRSLSWVEG
jgi:hypothetical protein